MSKTNTLNDDLDELRNGGVIDAETAERIGRFYEQKRGGRGKEKAAAAILSVLGAALACAGVVLLAAYNWHGFPRAAKTAIAALMILAPGAAGAALFRAGREPKTAAVESAALFHGLLFGAALALVGQIYQLPEDPVGFAAAYALSAMALSYLYGSLSAAAAALALAQILSFFLVVERGWSGWVHAALSFAALPLAFAFRRAGATARAGWTISLSVAALAASGLFMLGYGEFDGWIPLFAGFAAFGASLGALLVRCGEPAGAGIKSWGTGIGVVLAFACSWTEPWSWIGRRSGSFFENDATRLAAVLAILSAAVAAGRAVKERRLSPLTHLAPLILAAAVAGRFGGSGAVAAGACVVLYAAQLFVEGSRERSMKKLDGAFILSLAFALARFFDMTDSLAIRGAAFLAGGAALFLFNRALSRRIAAEQETSREA